jgi:spore maturation protein CgeB
MNNRAKIGLNWSSMDDTNARVFELPAMGLAPVMNYTSGLHEFLVPNEDYLEFTALPEAVEKVLWLKEHPFECWDMAQKAHNKIERHTYHARINQIFTESGF